MLRIDYTADMSDLAADPSPTSYPLSAHGQLPHLASLVRHHQRAKAQQIVEPKAMVGSKAVIENKTVGEKLKAMSDAKLERRIVRAVGKAIGDFKLIEEGDRILVGVSGGKDSWTLLHILNILRQRAPVKFTLVAVNIDQGFRGFQQDKIEDYLAQRGFEYHTDEFDTARLLEEKVAAGDTPCSLCSRLRRGVLYGLAEKLSCNKIALGHHLDDFIETLLLNQFFIGRNAAMAVKLRAEDQRNIVIRPLVYVREAEIIEYAERMAFPIVCCQCPLMCGETVHGDYKRRFVKKMLDILEVGIPEIRNSLLASLANVRPSHLLNRELMEL